jgi:transcriptional regulator with XRE-family HTH domain
VPRKPEKLKVLGDSIRQHRKRAGLSQEQLAEKADLHPVYIGKIERGEQGSVFMRFCESQRLSA